MLGRTAVGRERGGRGRPSFSAPVHRTNDSLPPALLLLEDAQQQAPVQRLLERRHVLLAHPRQPPLLHLLSEQLLLPHGTRPGLLPLPLLLLFERRGFLPLLSRPPLILHPLLPLPPLARLHLAVERLEHAGRVVLQLGLAPRLLGRRLRLCLLEVSLPARRLGLLAGPHRRPRAALVASLHRVDPHLALPVRLSPVRLLLVEKRLPLRILGLRQRVLLALLHAPPLYTRLARRHRRLIGEPILDRLSRLCPRGLLRLVL
mmetsp:Transcript_6029/g.17498  ORF Transcript_6029/g.17498 Transcript_6029/m.17498 type:complete len:260 (-) Transcript_6029:716-1495(-)